MKKVYFILFQFIGLGLWAQALTTNPSPIVVDQPVTITVFTNSTDTDCNHFNNPTKVYMHAGIGDDSNPWGFSVVGNWGQDDGVGLMNDNGDGSWSITITPSVYFGLDATQVSQATKMGMVFRNENGSQEFKDNGCADFILDVVQGTSSLSDFSGASFKVSPNPAKNYFSVSHKLSGLEIYDLTGKSIKKIDRDLPENTLIPLNGLKNGIYFVSLKFEEKIDVKKLIIRNK